MKPERPPAVPAVSAGVVPRPIGGWLILVGVGLLILPFRLLVAVVETIEPMTSDVWPLLATPGAPHYHPLFAPLVVAEIVVNMAFIGVAVLLLYCFFARKREFPRYTIGFVAANIAFVVADLALAQIVPVLRGIDQESMLDLARAAAAAAILIPYLRTSERVRATFVE